MKLYYFFLKTNQYFSTGQTIWLDPYPDRPSSGVPNMQVTRPIRTHYACVKPSSSRADFEIIDVFVNLAAVVVVDKGKVDEVEFVREGEVFRQNSSPPNGGEHRTVVV